MQAAELYRRLGRFADLIFCPLDLPAPPRVARQAMVEWVADARRHGLISMETRAEQAEPGSFPWRAVHAASDGAWLYGFEARFPRVVDYLEFFPTAAWTKVTVILQEPQRDVWLHTDPDPVLGWRVYLSHGGARVFFCPTFARHDERLSTWTPQGRRDWSKFVHTERRLYARMPADTGAWALNVYRAAHGVERHRGKPGERMTLVLTPDLERLDLDAYLALLERSARKYRDYAIWYAEEPALARA